MKPSFKLLAVTLLVSSSFAWANHVYMPRNALTAQNTQPTQTSRWVPVNGPQSGRSIRVFQLANNPSVLFGFDRGNEFYRSDDSGSHWRTLKTPDKVDVNNLVLVDGNTLLLTAYRGVYISTDLGEHWTLTEKSKDNNGYTFVVNPNLIFMVKNPWTLDEAYYRSTDGGKTWTHANIVFGGDFDFVSAIAGRDNIVLFGSDDHFRVSTDGGLSFNTMTPKPGYPVNSLAINSKNEVFVNQGEMYIYKTDLGGQNWQRLAFGHGNPQDVQVDSKDAIYVLSLVFDANDNTTDVLYKSTDDGITWKEIYSAPGIDDFTLLDNGQIVATTNEGVVESDISQQNFSLVNNSFTATYITKIFAADKTHLFSLEHTYGAAGRDYLYRSEDAGKTWTQSFKDTVYDIAQYNGQLTITNGYSLFTTTDFGKNWNLLTTLPDKLYFHLLTSVNGGMIAGGNEGSYFSTDLLHWKLFNADFDMYGESYYTNNTIFHINSDSIVASQDGGATWNTVLDKVLGRRNFIRGYEDKVLLGVFGDYGIYKSTDMGKSWETINTGFKKNLNFNDVSILDENTYVAAAQNLVYITHDGGNNWQVMNTGLKNQEVVSLFNNKDYLLATSQYDGIFEAVK